MNTRDVTSTRLTNVPDTPVAPSSQGNACTMNLLISRGPPDCLYSCNNSLKYITSITLETPRAKSKATAQGDKNRVLV